MTYVQLAHNVWDQQSRCAKTKVLHTFGRTDDLEVEALKRLTKSISRFLTPEDTIEATPAGMTDSLKIIRSTPMGGAYLLRFLWDMLGLHKVLKECLEGRSFTFPVEWVAFAMTANHALCPDFKRGVEESVREDVALGNPEPIELQHLYRAMDVLLEYREIIHKEVFWWVADCLNLEVDLIFFDTTSTYCETDLIDESEDGDGQERFDVLEALVMSRGIDSEENRLILQKVLGQYILGEKLRDSKEEEEHLDGKYILSTSDDTLSPEEVVLGYQQLMEVERAFRTLKTTLDLRPVYHRKNERIEADVFLYFLALLLVRIAERETNLTCDSVRDVMERLHLVDFFQKMDGVYRPPNRRLNRSTS